MLYPVLSPKGTPSRNMLRVNICLKYGYYTLLVPSYISLYNYDLYSKFCQHSHHICPPWLSKYEILLKRSHVCSEASKRRKSPLMSSVLKH